MTRQLGDYDKRPLAEVENQQHRYLWATQLVREANKSAWLLWMKIGAALATIGTAVIAIWKFLVQGVQ
jgi:hypothetical protein